MFSDVERSPSWHSPPLASDFGSHTYSSTTSNSTSRPPVQSGWFPLQDNSSSLPSDPSRATHEMYTDPAMLQLPAHRMLQNSPPWPESPVGTYEDNRPREAYGSLEPSTPTGYSPLYGYAGTPVAADDAGGFGWQDARPMAPPSIHTTGLEHLRMPYDDMHRVHAAAQGMHAMMGGPSGYPMGYGRYAAAPASLGRKKHKEISVGRWTSEEHRVFLKGLELYQGPSWGEIARMIGTRTSTQVRTHAQKFFTKLARTNQVLPYFENQIQKERARLVTQGAVPAGPTTMTTISAMDVAHSTVTPTSTTAHSYAYNTLSPPRKREFPPSTSSVHTSQRPGHSGYDDQIYANVHIRTPMQTTVVGSSIYSSGMDPTIGMDGYKLRPDSPASDFSMPRKPTRLNNREYTHMGTSNHLHPSTPSTPYGDQPMMAYSPTADTYRDPTVYAAPHGNWHDAAARPWPQSVDVTSDPTHAGDPDSLPSVTRLLYRGGPSS